MKNSLTIGQSNFWKDDDILYCQFNSRKSSYKLEADEVALYIETIIKLCNGNAMPFLVDTRNSRGTFSTASANLFAKSQVITRLRISEAYIINTLGIRLLIGGYKRIFEPTIPYAIFTNMADAKEYCIESKNKHIENY